MQHRNCANLELPSLWIVPAVRSFYYYIDMRVAPSKFRNNTAKFNRGFRVNAGIAVMRQHW
jgi:hypothetical protein